MPDDEVRHVLGLATPGRAAAGTEMLRGDALSRPVQLVRVGTVRLQAVIDRQMVTLALLGPGDLVLGLSFDDLSWPTVSAVAVERCEVLSFSPGDFEAVLARVPRLARNVFREMAARLAQAQAAVHAVSTKEVDARVARRLLDFAERYGIAGPGTALRLPLRVRQQDLAWLVGASRERTNRALVAFRQRGWIAVERDLRMTLLRPDLLAKRADAAR